nr:MAG TPA: hypothetical protein [Bacteriophage sp.]
MNMNMSNTLVVNGLKITTSLSYIKFIEAGVTQVEEDIPNSVLVIFFTKGAKNIELPFEVIIEEELKESDLLSTYNPQNKINNLNIKKLVVNEYILNQTIFTDLDKSYALYNEERCDLFINQNIEYKDYITLLKSIPFLEITEGEDDVVLANITNCLIGRRRLNYIFPNYRAFKYKDTYTNYVIDEPLVMYQVKKVVLEQLYDHGFESLKLDDQDELVEVPDVLSYSIQNADYNPIAKRVTPLLKRHTDANLSIEWKLKSTTLSKAMDIKNRYRNLEIISNLTSINVFDYNNNPFKVAIVWEDISGQLGDKSAVTDEENNYYHQLYFNCRVHFDIIMDNCKPSDVVISKITNLVKFKEVNLKEMNAVDSDNVFSLKYKDYDQIVKILSKQPEIKEIK